MIFLLRHFLKYEIIKKNPPEITYSDSLNEIRRERKQYELTCAYCEQGEHSDWNASNTGHGQAIAVATTMGLRAHAMRVLDSKCQIRFQNGKNRLWICQMNIQELTKEASAKAYYSYVAGTVLVMLEELQNDVGSIEICESDSTLPEKKGMSSSAAVCVLVVRAFARLYGLELSVHDEMDLAYRGERSTGSLCGRLDQICAYLAPGEVALLRFQEKGSDETETVIKGRIRLGKPVHLVLACVKGSKDTIKILNALQTSAKHDANSPVKELFGKLNDDVVAEAVYLLENGGNLGELASTAQMLFDARALPTCPGELTAPHLHAVLNDKHVKELATGGKACGAGGDGTCILFVENESNASKLAQYVKEAFHCEAWTMNLA